MENKQNKTSEESSMENKQNKTNELDLIEEQKQKQLNKFKKNENCIALTQEDAQEIKDLLESEEIKIRNKQKRLQNVLNAFQFPLIININTKETEDNNKQQQKKINDMVIEKKDETIKHKLFPNVK